MVERTVRYFDRPGPKNTQSTIEAVCNYLKESNTIVAIVIGSISGQTALKLKKALGKITVPVVCVTGAPC